jgi:integrase
MKAIKLPSGSFRCQAYAHGERKSFTAPTKKEAELMAIEWQNGRKKHPADSLTVGECITKYIDSKANILSPTTIDGYRRNFKNNLHALSDVHICDLTALEVQRHINTLSLTKAPKTVKNAYGLLVSALNVFAPELRLRCTLPKVQKQIKQLPKVEDVLKAIIGTDIELPCLLALWCSLRMSEIRGAKKSDIRDGVLTVRDTVVTVAGEHIEKHSTKTIESTRQIMLPERLQLLIAALPAEQVYLTPLSGQAIYKRFTRLLSDNGIEHMTFHDLRHMNASIMLMLGVPDKYAMERGGWSTPHIMKSVYQHTFTAERQEVDRRIDEYFNEQLHTLLHASNSE